MPSPEARDATWPSLPYDAVREADLPDETLLAFLQTTYAAAADLENWDRGSLERGRQ